MDFPEYLKKLIEAKDIYQIDLARGIKKTRPYIYQLCKGMKPTPKPKAMAALINAFGNLSTQEAQKLMDYSYRRVLGDYAPQFMGKQIEVGSPSPPSANEIPILSWAGAVQVPKVKNLPDLKGIEDWIPADPKGKRLFALRIKDSCMEPEFRQSEIITIDPDAKWKSGDFIVLRLNNDEEAIFKQINIHNDKTILHSLNRFYPDIKLIKKDFVKRATIIGKVIESKRKH